jgi:hypothetical protein
MSNGNNIATTVGELFDIRYGHSLELNKLTKVRAPDGIDFVGRAATNNGVSGRVLAPYGTEPGSPGEITVALSGQGGCMASFVQPSAFVTAYHVAILSPIDENMTLGEKLWWCTCIWANHYRYGFGRQANRTLAQLKLPNLPDFATSSRVDTFLREMTDHLKAIESDEVDPGESVPSRVSDLFSVRYGHSLELNHLQRVQAPSGVNFVSRTDKNNGVSGRVEVPAGVIPGAAGEMTVALGGSPLATFVQPEPFLCGRDVAILSPIRPMTTAEKIWWATHILANRYRFNYGRQANRTLGQIMLGTRPPGTATADRMNSIRASLKGGIDHAQLLLEAEVS